MSRDAAVEPMSDKIKSDDDALIESLTVDLGPFLASLLFGKCPMFSFSESAYRMPPDEAADFEISPKGGAASVDGRTASLTADDSSSTLSSCEQKQRLLSKVSGITSEPVVRFSSTDDTETNPFVVREDPAELVQEPLSEINSETKSTNSEQNSSQLAVEQRNDGSIRKESECQGEAGDHRRTTAAVRSLSNGKGKGRSKARVILPADFEVGASGPVRRDSFSSKFSRSATSIVSHARSAVSRATSIVSASKTVQSLPRELELHDIDEESTRSPSKSPVVSKRKRQVSDPTAQVDTYYISTELTDPYGHCGIYTGDAVRGSDKPHGLGRFVFGASNQCYEGDFKHGEWVGQGRLSLANGDHYQGAFHRGRMHGAGVLKYGDGRICQGDFMHGRLVQGQMTYPDGSTYDGGFVDGMRHGRGCSVFADNSLYVGEFREGEFHGVGKMLWMDGGYYEGEWEHGEMHGYGKEVLANGNVKHEGKWRQGQPIRNGFIGA